MKKILIIDDNEDILSGFGEICALKNWNAFLACDVDSGLKIFKNEEIDLVIIDYHMPVVNGFIGVRKLREISLDVPIIVLTVEESQEIADKFMEEGANDFALKPIKIPDFVARINVHLRYGKKKSKVKYKQVKGVCGSTLEVIEEFMKSNLEDLTIKEISNGTQFAYQTVHRYVNYLVEVELAEVSQSSGKKGRPKLKYRYRG